MKLFTFSGISSSLGGVNAGLGLIELANKVVAAMPAADKPTYTGTDDVDHFRSYVNFGTMLGNVLDAVRLTGSTVLNEEAARLSPRYAAAMRNAAAAEPTETVLILAHSQGTNNLTWTLLDLARNSPDFFAQRSVRCALFDPKVGKNYMDQIFGAFSKEKLSFLYFQSQNDVLPNQGMFESKFIKEFPFGDHIWVKGLDHGSIRDWDELNKRQYWLNRPGFLKFSDAWNREVLELRQEMRGGQLGPMQFQELDKWVNQYAKEKMNRDKLTEALIDFLLGELPGKFES